MVENNRHLEFKSVIGGLDKNYYFSKSIFNLNNKNSNIENNSVFGTLIRKTNNIELAPKSRIK